MSVSQLIVARSSLVLISIHLHASSNVNIQFSFCDSVSPIPTTLALDSKKESHITPTIHITKKADQLTTVKSSPSNLFQSSCTSRPLPPSHHSKPTTPITLFVFTRKDFAAQSPVILRRTRDQPKQRHQHGAWAPR